LVNLNATGAGLDSKIEEMKEEEAEDADDEKRDTLSRIQDPLMQNGWPKTSSESLVERKDRMPRLGRARCFLTWKTFCLFGKEHPTTNLVILLRHEDRI
jgi:hypothetical protein